MPNSAAKLIAIDWGTTHARSYLLGDGAVLLDQRQGQGISAIAPGAADRDAQFNAILDALVGEWLRRQPGLPMIACGMVGAAQGWQEAPYQSLPAQLAAGSGLVRVASDLGPLSIIGGVKKTNPQADVLRGEETQLAGLVTELAADRDTLVVLPGTHTKWARVRDARLIDFDTAMTGELFAWLAGSSMIGRVASPAGPRHDWRQGFDWGLRLAEDRLALMFSAFTIRSAVLDGQLPADQVADALSGLLIGTEIADRGQRIDFGAQPLVLVGGADLTSRYIRVFAHHAVTVTVAPSDTTCRGLWLSAVGAGLVGVE